MGVNQVFYGLVGRVLVGRSCSGGCESEGGDNNHVCRSAYGWPKLLSIDSSSPQPVVHICVVQAGWLLLVTATQVQVWSAGQHTTKLGQFKRSLKSREGSNIYALWGAKDNTVVVLTSESYLHFYRVKVSEKELRSTFHNHLELTLVSVVFTTSVDAALYNRTVTVSCIAGDEINIILGLSNNCLRIVSWNGEVLGVSDVLQEFVSTSDASHNILETNRPAVSPSSLLHQSSFSSSSRFPFSPLSVGDQTKIQNRTIPCSRNQAGTVEIFNLADSASYLRTISLIDWGLVSFICSKRYPKSKCETGIIVGVTQQLSLSGALLTPCFDPTPQTQPILPACILWHLLQRNKLEEALQLAKLSEGLPHFSRSLEKLLFLVFDAAMSSRRRGRNIAAKRTVFLLLQQVCNLIKYFHEYLDVLVSVARKTDSRHWPELLL